MRTKIFIEFVFSVFIIFSLIGNTTATENATVNMTVGNASVPVLNPGNFLENEAGISAYTKATSTINLNYAKNACRTTPEIITTNYFICSVPVPDLPETEDAHVYVSKSGWILAYHMRDIPVSKIVQWSNYNGGTITTTTLADVVRSVASVAGVSISPIKYYDFKYPGANRMMMIVDWIPDPGGTDSYQLKIPSSFVLNENSWSVRHEDSWRGDFNVWIDGNQFPDGFGTYNVGFKVRYGYYSSSMSPDIFHSVSSWTYGRGWGAPAGVNTVLVYRQP
jgi:hypothetical protein